MFWPPRRSVSCPQPTEFIRPLLTALSSKASKNWPNTWSPPCPHARIFVPNAAPYACGSLANPNRPCTPSAELSPVALNPRYRLFKAATCFKMGALLQGVAFSLSKIAFTESARATGNVRLFSSARSIAASPRPALAALALADFQGPDNTLASFLITCISSWISRMLAPSFGPPVALISSSTSLNSSISSYASL